MQELTPQRQRQMKRLLRRIVTFFDDESCYPRGHVFLDKVVLAHVSKSLNVAQGVMSLIDSGFPEEAFGLSRTMLEIALNLRFITNRHSEQRAKRFVHYISRWKMELVRRTLKHFYRMDSDGKFILDTKGNRIPLYAKAELQKLMRDYKKHAKTARKYPNRTSWTETPNRKSKGGAWMMAMEPDRHESINGVPLKWEFDYDWMYFWTSQYVHATVVSMEPGHATRPLHPFVVRKPFQGGPSTADMAVFNTAIQLNKILLMAFRALGQPFHPELANPLGDFVIGMVRDDPGVRPEMKNAP